MNKQKENLFIEDVNLLKTQESNLDIQNEFIQEFNNHIINDDDFNLLYKNFIEDNDGDNEEEIYVQSLKSSIYSEIFQKKLLKKIEFIKRKIELGDLNYSDFISNIIKDIDSIDVNKQVNNNIYITLKTLLESCIKNKEIDSIKTLNDAISILNESIKKISLINKEKKEIIDITLKAKNGDDNAKSKVLDFMKNDILKYAKKISLFNSNLGSDDFFRKMLEEDLFQEGQIGVLRGIQKFSPKKSDNVREYMKIWINQAMLSYITNKVYTIRLPVYVRQMYIKITRIVDEFTGKNIEYSIKNIAEHLGIDENKVKTILEHGKAGNVMNMSNLTSFFDDDNDVSIDSMPFMEDKQKGPEELLLEKENVSELQKTIKKILNKEEQIVIIHRYGLFGADQLLLKDLGEKLGKTEERIRQIENRALTILSIKYFDEKYGKSFRNNINRKL